MQWVNSGVRNDQMVEQTSLQKASKIPWGVIGIGAAVIALLALIALVALAFGVDVGLGVD